MGNNNANLQSAKNVKDDEFYTTYETFEKELSHYARHFMNKVVLCNCDDPFESNFCKYFLRNFNVLGIKRLICTSYAGSKVVGTQLCLFDEDGIPLNKGQGYVLDVRKFSDKSDVLPEDYVTQFLATTKCIKRLHGDGDFRSEECIRYLNAADIVVTIILSSHRLVNNVNCLAA